MGLRLIILTLLFIRYVPSASYSQFSFAVVIFYKVTVNTELVNTESPASRGNTNLGSCKALITFSPTNQYITLFYVCCCFIFFKIYICINEH